MVNKSAFVYKVVYKFKQYFLGILQIHKNQDDFELVPDGQIYLISGPQHFAI